MGNIKKYIRHGWHIVTELHTALWLRDFLFPFLTSGLTGIYARIQDLSIPVTIIMCLAAFAAAFVCVLALLGFLAEQKNNEPQLEPMYKAVAYVAAQINDADEQNCWEHARLAIRQAASDGKIKIYGHKSEHSDGNGGPWNRISVPIDSAYWQTADIGPLASSEKLADQFYTHTFPQKLSAGFSGQAFGQAKIYYYTKLKIDWTDVIKVWPASKKNLENFVPLFRGGLTIGSIILGVIIFPVHDEQNSHQPEKAVVQVVPSQTTFLPLTANSQTDQVNKQRPTLYILNGIHEKRDPRLNIPLQGTAENTKPNLAIENLNLMVFGGGTAIGDKGPAGIIASGPNITAKQVGITGPGGVGPQYGIKTGSGSVISTDETEINAQESAIETGDNSRVITKRTNIGPSTKP